MSIILVLSLTKTDLGDQDDDSMRVKSIEEVLREHTDGLMSIPGVVGTAQGICNNKPCIKVFVIKKTNDIDQSIPDELDGYPVEVEETGEFKALPQN
ncbi:MAG TPA: hypothetical protein VGA95_10755 [Thermodesulfobacteriota bacterium]